MRVTVIVRGGLLALGCLSAVVTRAKAQTKPLSIEAALAQPYFQPYAPVALSPDGAWVAYTLRYPNRADRSTKEGTWFTSTGVASTATGARARITELRTGRTVVVGDDSTTSWGPSWSPDGRYLAFYSDAGGLAHLWVRETATGRTRRVSDAIVRAHRAIQYPRWTPDSRAVVMPIIPYGSPLPEADLASSCTETNAARDRDSATVTVLRADPKLPYGGETTGGKTSTDVRESLRADLALVEIASGKVTTLAAGKWPHEFKVSADGRWVAFSSEYAPALRGRWTVPYDLIVVPIGRSKPQRPRMVAAGVAITNYATGVYWSPRGATLLYAATDSARHEHYYVADSSDWSPREVATAGVPDSIAASMRQIWWDDDGRSFYILAMHGVATVSMPDGAVKSFARIPDGYEGMALMGPVSRETAGTDSGRRIVVAFRNDSTKRMGFGRIDLATGAWRVLREEDSYYGARHALPVDVASDGRVVYVSETGQRPPDVWLATPGLNETHQVTQVAREMDGIVFGQTRLIEYTTSAGERRRATLLLPAGYREGVRYPLVVYPYPNDLRSNDVNHFGVTGLGVENMQLLATRGFAVLAPDIWPFDVKDEMRALHRLIMAGVDRTIALGIVDSTRLGITGHSWGGYTTIAMIAQTPRFGAAVMRGGMADLVADLGALQTSGFAYGAALGEFKFGATLWEQPEIYRKNSPIYLLDRVHTPLLIIHGRAETTVPYFLAGQTFAGLQRLGREVELVGYENENHGHAQWSYANQRDYLTRLIGWFESHLKPNEAVQARQ